MAAMSMVATPAITQAAIYARVSQDRLKTARSVAEQEAECRAACEAQGWPVAAVYRDSDRSASRFATKPREQWERLVADLADGRFGVLVLWEPSRGTRELDG